VRKLRDYNRTLTEHRCSQCLEWFVIHINKETGYYRRFRVCVSCAAIAARQRFPNIRVFCALNDLETRNPRSNGPA